MTDSNENPDQFEENGEGDPEVRTDGGEVVPESVQGTEHQPDGAATPGDSSQDKPWEAAGPTQATETGTGQNMSSPGNWSTEPDNSAASTTADDVFSGAASVDDVIEFYLEMNPWGVQASTVKSYKSRLKHFQAFCRETDIEELEDLQPSHIDQFHNFLRANPGLGSRSSVKSCLATFRKFLRYCERRGVFESGFHKLVILPTLSESDAVDETILPHEDAEEILAHLAKFKPFTKEHVVWALLTETGIRQSTLYAFDLDDYDSEERYIAAVDREETGTRLKNGKAGERELSISPEAAEVLDGYITANRKNVTDEHGRDPLITTRNGRLQKSSIRQYVYGWSRPCAIGKACPVEKDPDTCGAAQTNNAAYDCPESVSPHPIRRGYITHLRANGVPTADVISKRCDANPETIEQWYDLSTKSERREARRSHLEDL
ncbi:tyrosine-type recombinase/integrase [Halorubrum ezzemoulense]|uniref:Site-specific integrase n=1 Tax=Halorubrum ezzemoulense TaxID=337243 RepID=A0A481RIK2_HALEZ|nr:site-specific integrase [Halorubrum ezzemoulense]QAY21061.1 site-specific integrase [Halorubrum ezzemoulense]